MDMNMLLSEMVDAASDSWLVRQLIHLKRCFGSRAKIGVIAASGEVDLCGTVAELVSRCHVPTGLEWMDPFLAAVPSISELPANDFAVVPSRYSDGGSPCPWDVARRKQEAARARANEARQVSHRQG